MTMISETFNAEDLGRCPCGAKIYADRRGDRLAGQTNGRGIPGNPGRWPCTLRPAYYTRSGCRPCYPRAEVP